MLTDDTESSVSMDLGECQSPGFIRPIRTLPRGFMLPRCSVPSIASMPVNRHRGSLLYVWVCLRPWGRSVSGYQSSSSSASPAFSVWVSLRCLNCINSPVASRNLDTFAARAGVPRSLVRFVSRLSAHISSLSSLNSGHSSNV